MLRLRSLLVFGAALSASPVLAATLEEVSGVVLVNAGDGFRRKGSGVEVPLGARVLARSASSAVIVYENGCREKIASGESAIVKSSEACRHTLATRGVAAGLATLAVGAALLRDDPRPASP